MLVVVDVEYFTTDGVEYKKEIYSNGATVTTPVPQPVEVKVYIGVKEYDAYTYKASERGKKIVGKQPIKIGG